MSAAIQVRKLPDGTIQARRLDGAPLTAEDRGTVRRLANDQPPATVPAAPFTDPAIIATMLEGDQPVAVLIDSKVIGAKVWTALREDWKTEPGVKTPVFYPSELPALREKSAAQLKSIYNVKAAFACVKGEFGKARVWK